MLRMLAMVGLVAGVGLMLGGVIEDVAHVQVVEDASACDYKPGRPCGSCWVDEGDLENGVLPSVQCHN